MKPHTALLILNLSSGVQWSASHPSCCLHDTRPQYPLNCPHRSTMIFYIVEVPKSLVSRYHGNYVLYSGAKHLWIFIMELASCHLLAPSMLRCLSHFWELWAPPAIWIHAVWSTLQLYSWANMATQLSLLLIMYSTIPQIMHSWTMKLPINSLLSLLLHAARQFPSFLGQGLFTLTQWHQP